MAKPTFKIEKNKEETTVVAHGDLTVQHANELKKLLVPSLTRKGNELFVLSQVTAFDATAVQLSYAWKKELEKQGRKATITLPSAQGLSELLEKTGINKIL
jgi:anti-anti-sigma factor